MGKYSAVAARSFIQVIIGLLITIQAEARVALAHKIPEPGVVVKTSYYQFPVDLISFQAKLLSNKVNISFTVANVMNFSAYEIEWGTDGSNFMKIAVISELGQTNLTASYFFRHQNPSRGKNYYRLRLVGKTGDGDFSLVRAVNQSKELVVNIFPNPAQQYISVDFSGSLNLNSMIDLVDFNGRAKLHIDKINSPTINISLAGLNAGRYYIVLIQDGYIKNKYPFIITK